VGDNKVKKDTVAATF
jgi:hypothetical protein